MRDLLAQADRLRADRQWSAALEGYRDALTQAPRLPVLHHNAGLCLYALSRCDEALASCTEALRLEPGLWQALVVRVKVLRQLGRIDEALAVLAAEPRHDLPALEAERASLALHHLGDAAAAGELATQPAALPTSPDLQLTRWLAALYDRGPLPAEEVAAGLVAHAQNHLGGRFAPVPVTSAVASPRRRRIGVISPQLRATPVFFFGIGALRLLAAHVDLVFFHRSVKEDWATLQFRAIATDWIDVAALEPIALEQEIRSHSLDVLIDMGGWMDTPALRALSTKPAKRMVKWVGGQAASTGLAAFDGFLSDIAQSPPELQSLYVEPLRLLESGYVTYTPPAYFPSPRPAEPGVVLGVIANPAKISRAFLHYLAQQSQVWRSEGIVPTLRFIEHRFQHSELQNRIKAALRDSVSVEFIVPDGHLAYLNEVAKLHTVIDTFPYTGGLTTIEALMLGVPCRTRAGTLFCERHTFAHCHYSGMETHQYALDDWCPNDAGQSRRRALLAEDSPRLSHAKLADELLRIFSTN